MLLWILLAVLIFFSAFFSGMETALTSVSRLRAELFYKRKLPGSLVLKKLKEDMQTTVITILIGNNIVNIASAVIATVLFTNILGSLGAGVATGVMTFLTLTFGEIIPKSYALIRANAISLKIGFAIYYLRYPLYPLVIFFRAMTYTVNKLTGNTGKKPLLTEEDFQLILSLGEQNKVLERNERRMIEEVLKLNDLKAGEVMISSKDVFCLDGNQTIRHVLAEINDHPYSRIPIYIQNKRNMIGFVHIRDLLTRYQKLDTPLKDLVKKQLIVSQGEILDDIFKKMNQERKHIAFVQKNQHFLGIITLEDILEEVFGEIQDESD